MNENDLDTLINQFQSIQPSIVQMRRWSSIRVKRRESWRNLLTGLAAGLAIGFMSSQFFWHVNATTSEIQLNSEVKNFYHSPMETLR